MAGQTITCGDDWSVHKKGSKNKLFFAHMTSQFHNEYPLILELEKISEIKSIKIGFLTDNSFNDKIGILPLSIIV